MEYDITLDGFTAPLSDIVKDEYVALPVQGIKNGWLIRKRDKTNSTNHEKKEN